MLRKATTCLIGLVLSIGCAGTHQVPRRTSVRGFTPEQRRIADQIISIFENDTPTLRYDYVENLHDGRGYTAGRAGFCSGDHDMSEVVALYCKSRPGNPLAKLLPLLRSKAENGDDSVSDLDELGFKHSWQLAAKDPVFREAQDKIVDRLDFQPALKHWQQEGCSSPLALLAIYDTEVQQGDGADPDGTPALISETDRDIAGNPSTGVDEKKWLTTFLTNRGKVLRNPHDQTTRTAWSKSVSRVTALEEILKKQNLSLRLPLQFRAFDENWRITAERAYKLPDNG